MIQFDHVGLLFYQLFVFQIGHRK